MKRIVLFHRNAMEAVKWAGSLRKRGDAVSCYNAGGIHAFCATIRRTPS